MSDDVRLKWNPDPAIKNIEAVIADGLWLWGQTAITEAMRDVPLDTGTLRRSATVTVDKLPDANAIYNKAKSSQQTRRATTSSPSKSARIVYVSYNTPYAIWLHESSSWKPRDWKRTAAGHKVQKPAVGQWKWLSRALSRIKGDLPKCLKRAETKYQTGVIK